MLKFINHPAVQLLINAVLISLLVFSILTENSPVIGLEQWDIIATVAWALVPWALIALAFYGASSLKAAKAELLARSELNKAKALEAEANMWALRHSSKQAREYAARRG